MRLWYRWRQSLPSIVLGAMLLAFGGFSHWLALRSRHWPVTSGVITKSFVRTKHDNILGRTMERGATITYQYSVAGRTYRGGVVSFGETSASNADLVRRYPEGAVVEVHYDREHPDLAVLEPGAGRRLDLLVLLGIGLIGYGVWRGLR